MGSELTEYASGRIVWGMTPQWYLRSWTSSAGLELLALSDSERDGKYGRLRPTRLIRFPAYAPILSGIEPYTKLIRSAASLVIHPAAIIEFPYDWRLPVTYNAQRLAEVAVRHLERWAKHPRQVEAQRQDLDRDSPRVIVVAHSMGGLLVQELPRFFDAERIIRTSITIGTPFHGAPKVVLLLNSGAGSPLPLPRQKLRRLAEGMPGMYDLLPAYRCVDNGAYASQLNPNDVERIGGQASLARLAVEARERRKRYAPPNHVAIVGAHQPTAESISVRDGVVFPNQYSLLPGRDESVDRVRLGGDGTVPRLSTRTNGGTPLPLAQRHGALPRMDEVALVLEDVILRQETGPWLGAGEIGADIPDIVTAGETFYVAVSGVDHPREVSCTVVDAEVGRSVTIGEPTFREGQPAVALRIDNPGIYRVAIGGGSGGQSLVSELVLVCGSSDR